MSQKFYALLAAFGLLFLLSTSNSYAETNSSASMEIFIKIGEKNFSPSEAGAYLDARTNRLMVPLSFVKELDTVGNWIPSERKITFTSNTIKIEQNRSYANLQFELQQETKDVVLFNNSYHFETSPIVVNNNQVFVPLRLIAEALGYKINWDSTQKGAIITKPISEEKAIQIADSLPHIPQKGTITQVIHLRGMYIVFWDFSVDCKKGSIRINDITGKPLGASFEQC